MNESLISAVLSAAEPVSWILIHSLWLGGLIALLLAATLLILRQSKPQLRYAIACATLLLIIPLSMSTALYTSGGNSTTAQTLDDTNSATATSGPATKETSATTVAEAIFAGALSPAQRSAMPWIFLAWLMGVSMLSLYHTFGWRRAKRLVRLGSVSVPPAWQDRFTHLRKQIGATSAVSIMKSPFLTVPCVVGWVKPTVLVPVSAFTGLTVAELEMILAHELAHVRRHDVLINYLQTAMETILFFNPAVWWISRQIRIEREHCCDDLAVGVCNDRLAYARALSNLERLRTPQPHLAPAANGTSLLKRVGRLLGAKKQASRWPGFSIVGVLSLATLFLVALSAADALTPVDPLPVTDLQTAVKYVEQREDMHGDWEIDQYDERIKLELRFSRRGQTTFPVEPEQLIGLTKGNDVQFQLLRDAGTFFFEGNMEMENGEYYGDGVCHFRGNPEYVDKMERLGFNIRSTRKLFELALHNVTIGFAQGLADLGYDDMSLDRLVEMHIHRVTPQYVKELDDLGYRNLDVSRLVEMRIHRVTPEYVKALNDLGYSGIRPAKLVEMRIHRVDPDFIRGLVELGYDDIEPSKLVEMSIHRVSPDYIRRMKESGYTNISPSKLIEMNIHRVDPGYVAELIELGYEDISPSKLVEMRIHSVDISYIKALKELGYDKVDPSDLVAMSIHNVTPKFIEKLQKRKSRGRLDPDDLIEYRIHGSGSSWEDWD